MQVIQAVILFALAASALGENHLDYNDQPDWTGICPFATQQSPINFPAMNYFEEKVLIDMNFNYTDFKGATMVNEVNTIKVSAANPWDIGSLIVNMRGEKLEYLAYQFHFHSPSEHTLQGKQFDAELHIVHKMTDEEIAAHPNERPNAVLGVFFTASAGASDNAFVKSLELDQLSVTGGSTHGGLDVKIEDFLEKIAKKVNHYEGSLTTPPCTEAVQWYVLIDPQPISTAQLALFSKFWASNTDFGSIGNNRAPVAINYRSLYRNYDASLMNTVGWGSGGIKTAVSALGLIAIGLFITLL